MDLRFNLTMLLLYKLLYSEIKFIFIIFLYALPIIRVLISIKIKFTIWFMQFLETLYVCVSTKVRSTGLTHRLAEATCLHAEHFIVMTWFVSYLASSVVSRDPVIAVIKTQLSYTKPFISFIMESGICVLSNIIFCTNRIFLLNFLFNYRDR